MLYDLATSLRNGLLRKLSGLGGDVLHGDGTFGSMTTISAEQATTSGTSIDFTGIPAGVRRITIMLVGVSTNGTSNPLIQLGDAGGVETSGYLGSGSTMTSVVSSSNFTTGFGILAASAAAVMHGTVELSLQDAANFTWVATGIIGASNGAATLTTAGSKSLSAELTRVRVTTVGGVDTFDAGAIAIGYHS